MSRVPGGRARSGLGGDRRGGRSWRASPVARGWAGGFTLIEILIVMAIVGIMALFAVPAMRGIILDQRLKAAANELHLSLFLARSEAVKRNTGVTVAATGGDWADGWSVTVTSGGALLRAADALNGVTVTAPASSLEFGRDGRASVTGSIQLVATGEDSVSMRCIDLTLAGMPTTAVDTDGDSSNGCN
ncbi:MAG: GspH/FimT family pseudopilin [Magnetococcales bacterium]|nr:GspH/FimT family pseudopilin [Magnetococcales bacterium]MBF0157797.1 GspH/FimT family pseudopilin [Magnetococcales bacterium]